jgi:hypothetical protein
MMVGAFTDTMVIHLLGQPLTNSVPRTHDGRRGFVKATHAMVIRQSKIAAVIHSAFSFFGNRFQL